MKIRDAHATINGDKTIFECPSGSLQIIADDGRTLFEIGLENGQLRVSAGNYCRHCGVLLSDGFVIAPCASNVFYVRKLTAKGKL